MEVTAVILTKNEEKNIDKCLYSLAFCDEIIVIDDFSTDRTEEKIKKSKYPVKLIQRELRGDFAAQRNFAMKKAKNDWVLFIDADEEVSRGLIKEITHLKFEKDAYYINRRDFFWGRELKYGETMEARKRGILRLVHKNAGIFMGNVHEVFHTAKSCGHLKKYLNHYPHPTLKEFINDINIYSSLRAKQLFARGHKGNILELIFFPLGKFIISYFFLLGFLDGPPGFTYSFLMSFHSFLVRAKLYQYSYLKGDAHF